MAADGESSNVQGTLTQTKHTENNHNRVGRLWGWREKGEEGGGSAGKRGSKCAELPNMTTGMSQKLYLYTSGQNKRGKLTPVLIC